MKLKDRVLGFLATYAPRPRRIFRRRSSTMQLSHMDSFPEELLVHIFRFIARDSTSHPIAISTLTHVSSRWRLAALSSGSLWARIVLTFPVRPRHISYVVVCLERSGSHPLEIFLDFRDAAWNWDEDSHSFRWQNMEPIMRLFLVHVTRWRRFELLADTWSPIFTFLWYTRHVKSAPALEALSLSRCNLYFAAPGHNFQPASLRQPLPFFGGNPLPSLKSVLFTGVHIDWEQPSLRNLTELELKFQSRDVMPTLSQFEAIFHASPGLLRLAIFGWGPIMDVSTAVANGQLHLQRLQRLSFGFLDIPYSLHLLSLFDFPSLSELVLEDISRVVSPSDLQDGTSLIQWLSSTPNSLSTARPSNTAGILLHQLTNLEIHNIRCDELSFRSFLQQMTLLTTLGLFDVANGLLALLMPQNDLETVCAQLEELHCQDMDPDTVRSAVASRALVDLPLRKVAVEFVRKSAPSLDSLLYRQLVSMGVEIQGKSGSDLSDSQSS